MACPQKENGHIGIATELVEAFARNFPGKAEGQILWAIIRKTYGWSKKEDRISIRQLQELTGLSRRTVVYGLQNLEAKKMIKITRKKKSLKENEINTISLQKDYEKWTVLEKSKQYSKLLEKQRKAYGEKTTCPFME